MKQPVVVDRSQKRIGDFFKRPVQNITRSHSSSSGLSIRSPNHVNTVDRLAIASRNPQINLPKTSSTSGSTIPAQKRSRDTDEGCNSDSSNDCIILNPRPIKSPRTSPSPTALQQDHLRSEPYRASSNLSPIDNQSTPSSATPTPTQPHVVPGSSSFSTNGTTSFISSSSLISSSQRIVKDGTTIAVRNSDDEGSDDSLEDLDDLLGPSNPPLLKSSSPLTELSHTPSPPPDISGHIEQPLPRRIGTGPPSKVKFNLNALIKRARRGEERKSSAEETIRQIKVLDEHQNSTERSKEQTLEELIQNHGPEEGRERFKEALSRTEVLLQSRQWSFFDYATFDEQRERFVEDANEALKDLTDERLVEALHNPSAFGLLLSSGMLHCLFKRKLASDKSSKTLFQLAIYHPHDDTRKICQDILTSADCRFITIDAVAKMFKSLGARLDALEIDEPISTPSPSPHQCSSESSGWHFLGNLLEVLQLIPDTWPNSDRTNLLLILLRLSIDDAVTRKTWLKIPLARSIAHVLSTFNDSRLELARQIFNQSTENSFRLRILNILPIDTQSDCLLKQSLALAWFLQDSDYLPNILQPDLDKAGNCLVKARFLVPVPTILSVFKLHPEIFLVNRKTDFTKLKTYVQLLSVGFNCANAIPEEEERAFNADIDQLADAIKSISADIIDSGASHASRIETKDVLDTFNSRLLYSFRTKPRPRKDILGRILSEDDPSMGQRSMFQFLKEKRKTVKGGKKQVEKVESLDKADDGVDDLLSEPKSIFER